MRKELLALLGSGCLLTGCQAPPAQAQADLPPGPVIAKAPNDPGAAATLCAETEDVIISCRLKDSAQIASICISPAKGGEPRKVRFAQGLLGKTPVLQHAADSSNSAAMFRWTHLLRAGATGAYVYTFEHDGLRLGFHSEQGTHHALAGLFQSQPASSKAINDQPCDMSTLVEYSGTDLARLVRTWQKDPQIYEDDLPVVEDNSRK